MQRLESAPGVFSQTSSATENKPEYQHGFFFLRNIKFLLRSHIKMEHVRLWETCTIYGWRFRLVESEKKKKCWFEFSKTDIRFHSLLLFVLSFPYQDRILHMKGKCKNLNITCIFFRQQLELKLIHQKTAPIAYSFLFPVLQSWFAW